MLRAFFKGNRRLSHRVGERTPNAAGHTYRHYAPAVWSKLDGAVPWVLDVGGGAQCIWAKQRPRAWRGAIVAADIAPEELARNEDTAWRVVLDGCGAFPFDGNTVPLITTQSVLEHLPEVEAFVRESARVLVPGGYSVHWVPSRYAPFARINALLPNAIARRLLFFTDPGKRGICGFPVVYDHCTPAEMQALFERHGFDVEEVRPSWYQSPYFAFFFPAFLVSLAYEYLLLRLNARPLCAHFLIVARKRS